ncbi:hypothetical protein [Geoglobus acetivorans]|uniref:Uncharacterized protein n=1 Tax=Geoglobus acetivorans TaxID=565033 RepID=A0A0A7GDD1_GEOAI|nr:hypothetical protein GACE_1036 [Geoglobus acetivorans]
MNYRHLSLTLAVISGIVSVNHFIQTPLYGFVKMFIPDAVVYTIVAIPVIAYLANRSVFSIPYFIVLLMLTILPSATGFEVFEGILDSIYYLGFRDISKEIAGLLNFPFSMETAYIIFSAFIVSVFAEGVENHRVFESNHGKGYGYLPTFMLVLVILAAYYNILSGIPRLDAGFVQALIAAFAILMALWAMWWWK